MDSCNFTIEANSHTFEVEIQARQKLGHFGRYVAKAKLLVKTDFVSVTQAGVFIWENFLGRKNRNLGDRASLATSKFLRRKEWRGEITETVPG